MSAGWQLLIVAAVIGIAAAFLGRRIWQRFSTHEHDSGCGSCSRNPQNASAEGEIVSLESLTSKADELNRRTTKRQDPLK